MVHRQTRPGDRADGPPTDQLAACHPMLSRDASPACLLRAGRMKPRSPAKPQQCTASTVTTSALQRRAMARSLSVLPILRTLHTGCSATASACGAMRSRGSRVPWANSRVLTSDFPVASIVNAHLAEQPSLEQAGQLLRAGVHENARVWRRALRRRCG